jgi:hypothetical protein
MMISFRTKLFDTTSAIRDDTFRGEDLARWLEQRLSGWSSTVISEDWGWAVVAQKRDYQYIFGVYDHDHDEVAEQGPKWVLRLFNMRDRSKRLQKLLRYIPPVAHNEVVQEITEILRQDEAISDIKAEPL